MDSEAQRCWRAADALFSRWLDAGRPDIDAFQAAMDGEPRVMQLWRRLVDAQRLPRSMAPRLQIVSDVQDEAADIRNRLAGRRVGGWELLEEIGRGGMSVVYRARRVGADFEQLAAVKLLGLAAFGSEGASRFERERRLLARLRHPNIAAFIDGGFGEDGTPFLAMALVEGRTLADYCRETRPHWRSRVRLLRQVCDAVAHAHRNLMVHRDLKPANIMVTPSGVPMLLDFGIAKLLDDDGAATRTGLRALTPDYAAPEQLEGREITTATDVFALGLILREICASDPRAPRDLHSVVAKATRAEAERRYPDARALGEDLDRLLQQRAISAIPDSPGYRLRKLLQRHRAASLAVAGIVSALTIGLAGVLWQAQLTRDQARAALAQAARAEATRDFLFTLLGAGDRERYERVDVPVSRVIERGISALETSPPDDPRLHAEVAMLLGQIDLGIGGYARAEALIAVAAQQAERVDDPVLSAEVRVRRGLLANARGDSDAALTELEAAWELARSAPSARSEEILRTSLGGWAYAMSNSGRSNEALQRLDALLTSSGAGASLALTHDALMAQAIVAPDHAARLGILREIQALHARLPPTPADRLALETMLGSAHLGLGEVERGIAHMAEAVRWVDRIHPGMTVPRARSYNNLGSALSRAQRLSEADRAFAIAEEIYRALGETDSAAFAALLNNRGLLLRDIGAAERALPLLEQAHAIARRRFGESDGRRLTALRNIAATRAEIGADPRSESEWREVWNAGTESAAGRQDLLLVGVQVALANGDLAAAAERIEQLGALPPDLAAAKRLRWLTLRAIEHSLRGEVSLADAQFAHAERLMAAGEPVWSAHWRLRVAQAEHLQRSNRPREARAQFVAALDLLQSRHPRQESAPQEIARIRRLRQQLAALPVP